MDEINQMNNTVVFPTACFPPTGYLSKLISKNGEAIIDIGEFYIKQTYRNHYNISGPNGKQTLTIPISKPFGNKTQTKDIIISEHGNWRHLHKNALIASYNSSPFFEYYVDELFELIDHANGLLWEFNHKALMWLVKKFDLNLNFTYSNEYLAEASMDFRNVKEEDFIHIVQFSKYYQVFNHKYDFQANLSSLDLLFNEGPYSNLKLPKATL